MSQRTVIAATIASGTSLSAEVNVDRLTIVGIQMPAGWDAAGIAFQALIRESGNPAVPVYGSVQDQAGTAVGITSPALDTYVAVAPTIALRGLGRIKVRSGTNAAPVNQTATRVLYLVCIDETTR